MHGEEWIADELDTHPFKALTNSNITDTDNIKKEAEETQAKDSPCKAPLVCFNEAPNNHPR